MTGPLISDVRMAFLDRHPDQATTSDVEKLVALIAGCNRVIDEWLTSEGWTVEQAADGTWQTSRHGVVYGDGYPTAEAAWEEIRVDQQPDPACDVCRGGGCPHCDDTAGRLGMRAT